jgi:hypothetical protein
LGLRLITPAIRFSSLVLIAERQKFSALLKFAWRWSAGQQYLLFEHDWNRQRGGRTH